MLDAGTEHVVIEGAGAAASAAVVVVAEVVHLERNHELRAVYIQYDTIGRCPEYFMLIQRY